MPVIEINFMSKVYRGKRGSHVRALQELSLAIDGGEVFGFLGPNGAGKSTTIKTLVGLITPTTGSALLCGRPVSDASARRSVGYLPENPAFYDFLSATEYLAFVGDSFGMTKNDLDTRSREVLGKMELLDAAKRPIRTYSKGMVQRLGLAQAMLHDPEVYILDEPMSGLDPLGRSLVKDIIRELKANGKTVFFSTHITSDVEAVCDRVGVIVDGRLMSLDSVDDLMVRGIEGYRVQVRNVAPELLEIFPVVASKGDHVEFQVSCDDLKRVLESVVKSGGEVLLVEPKRKDLESFFLEIVSRGKG
jgi:ABC-2 type transport system ATP-binding protein